MNMFESSVRYMERQTIGFENIEWIVVLHNCDAEHIKAVRERIGSCENVVLKVVNNDIHTPSSPRNHGMDLASAKYIGFLDGDDNYRVDAIERILKEFQKSEAQMVVFRREFTLEKPGITAISETVNWNQTRESIVITKDGSVENKIYNDFPFFVTSRAYDREFLDEHHIRFDDSVTISEDCYFNLEVMRYAEKICYCPQLIGYNYFVNSGSMLNSKQSDESIISMIESAVKIIKRTYDYGMYPNVIIKALCFVLSRYAASPDVSNEVKLLMKDSLEKYLHTTVPIPEGRFTEPFNTLLNTLPQQVFASITRTGKIAAKSDGRRTLLEILSENKNTDFGRRYHFEDIVTPKGYQNRVPISDYETYAAMIDLCISIGEKNIFTSKPIAWYAKQRDGRCLPVTASLFQEFSTSFTRTVKGKTVFFWYENVDTSEVFNDGVAASNVVKMSLAGYFDSYRYSGERRPYDFTSPDFVYFLQTRKPEEVEYIHMLLALANREIDQLICTSASETGLLLMSLKENKERLCHDLECGEVSADIELSDYERKVLRGYLAPDKERADEVRKILFESTSFDGVGAILWPKLKYVTCMAGGLESSFRKNINKYFGNVEFSNGCFSSCEGVFGEAIGDTNKYELVTGNNFYEFLENDRPDEVPVFKDELVAGKTYHLIVTTHSGLYRYKTSAVLEICSVEDGKIIFKVIAY